MVFQDYSGYKLPLAIAIVLSGQYEDDLDNCEDIVYTGQGGNNLLGNRRQVKDQVMERGNLALKVSVAFDSYSRLFSCFGIDCLASISHLLLAIFSTKHAVRTSYFSCKFMISCLKASQMCSLLNEIGRAIA